MEWSATSATKAYLETLQLCNNPSKLSESWKTTTREPGSNEFISALAAGMKSKLIVEIKSSVSPSTIALATAAKHTGARFVCILPETALNQVKKETKDSGLIDIVEFNTGDPTEILQHYEQVDFSLVDCKNDDYPKLLKMINVNPKRSIVVANNLEGDKEGFGIGGRHVTGMKDEVTVRSMKHPIGKGMEITTIGSEKRGILMKKKSTPRANKSKWIVKVDEVSVSADADDPLTAAADGNAGRYELCDTDLSFLGPPYGNISASNFICSPIWNTFVLRYFQREDNLMTIILSAVYTTGWVGIGFSRNGMMLGSSAMVGWFNKKGHARIKQYYLQGAHISQVIADKGELPLTNIPPVVALHGPMIYIAFQAKFEHRLGRQPIILAFGTRYPNHFHLSKHDDKTAVWFDFSQASFSGIDISQKKNHGILGIFGWGLFLPAGAMVARYLKHKDPLWYYLHAGIQFVGFILGLAAVVLGVQLYRSINADVPAHRGIGIFVLVLSILQIMAFFLRPNKDSKYRRYWNWYHHWFGRMALFFGALNVILGIQYGGAGDDWKIGYGFLLGLTLLVVILLEVFTCLRNRNKSDLPSNFQMNPSDMPSNFQMNPI
ncbi:Cytochrome b561, eukaryote [Corchorus capsularis]|uniref:Cytochrome b561, eukaryote n=1 Tax=Corchorus capsularis TaxID=210143 RepID=A0A1R3H1S8_COCAP|nr:Cytochrome b561, eukaryote [Corchorus capsularis]